MTTKTAAVVMQGGLNLASPVLLLNPGEALQLTNYELDQLGRYRSVQGFERYDGQAEPHTFAPINSYNTQEEYETAYNTAVEAQRALIGKVPGSGAVRGGFIFKGVVYAFRDNVAADAAHLYKATATGWQQVVIPAMLPGGRFEFREANFIGLASGSSIYGVDGVNEPFVFDGTTLTPITTGASQKPTHLEIFRSRLWLGFREGSVMYSVAGTPTDFDGASGAGEIGIGGEVVALEVQNQSLAIWSRNQIDILYGTSPADFRKETFSRNSGAREYTVQPLGDAMYLDDRGLTSLARVQAFGDFEQAALSLKVKPILDEVLDKVVASCVVKSKNQYRLFFNNGSGLIATFAGKEVSGFSVLDFGDDVRISCAFTGETDSGEEAIFYGSEDGYLFRADRGTSFDGQPIETISRLAFNNVGSPTQKKRWRKLTLEIETSDYVVASITPDFDYSNTDIPEHVSQVGALGGGGYWGSVEWTEFFWSTPTIATPEIHISGIAQNMGLLITSFSTVSHPHTLNSYLVDYSPRGRKR